MIETYDNADEFLKKYGQYFISDEIRYGLIMGITKRNINLTLLISSEIENRFVVGVLAGKNLIIASNTLEEDVYEDLVEYMKNIEYPGIIGSKEHCNVYHSKYKEVTGENMCVRMDQRIYSCNEVSNNIDNIGIVRLATFADIDFLVEWAYDFNQDVDDKTTLEESRMGLEYKVNSKTLYVLVVNNEIVSMAARSRSLSTTESVGFVYTPIKHRRKGYASRLVSEVSKEVINDGRIATLYTDLSNPTSNSIYMKIGYKPHCDSIMLNKIEKQSLRR